MPRDFLDLGTRGAIDMALRRLVQAGRIRRLCRGVYDYPLRHDRLGALSPSLPKVAQAIARSGGMDLQPSGALAANALGLSSQVPAQLVYHTNGTSRTVRVGNQVIRFKRTAPRGMLGAGTTAGVVVQALRYLGGDAIHGDDVASLLRRLKDPDKRQLAKLIPDAPAWMRPILESVCESSGPPVSG